MKWLYSNGYEDQAKITRYQKLIGKDLAEADDKWLEDVFGILEFTAKQKIKYSIQKYQQTTWSEIILWGWGSNLYGQLGL